MVASIGCTTKHANKVSHPQQGLKRARKLSTKINDNGVDGRPLKRLKLNDNPEHSEIIFVKASEIAQEIMKVQTHKTYAQQYLAVQKQIASEKNRYAEIERNKHLQAKAEAKTCHQICFCNQVVAHLLPKEAKQAKKEANYHYERMSQLLKSKDEKTRSYIFAKEEAKIANSIASTVSRYLDHIARTEELLVKANEISKKPNGQIKGEFQELSTIAASIAVESFEDSKKIVYAALIRQRSSEIVEGTIEMAASVAELLGKNCYKELTTIKNDLDITF